MEQDRAVIDSLVARFFAVFDNRSGRTPRASDFEALFVPSALIATHTDGMPKIADPLAFVQPRITLLTSGALVDFHEWETQSQTEILGSLGVRRSRYSKRGLLDGRPFEGAGTKYFHFARLDHAWRIVFVSWIDDQMLGTNGGAWRMR
jgi:hypothetical protein